jgi:N-acyl-D-amino-acid deacylase
MHRLLCSALLTSLVVGLSVTHASAQETFDVLIRGGHVIDGTGNPWFAADVGIRDQRIVRIGNLDKAEADRVIDASGLIVAPGFIDPHTHAIRGIFDVPEAESALLQGVTTLLEGNDGTSPYPIDEHLERIESIGISPNWAVYVGQGTIRSAVMGTENRPANSEELDRMRELVTEAMEHGAIGISTGLLYVPGNFTPTEEIVDLARIVADYGGIYISHMRDEVVGLLDSVKETIQIGEEAGIPVQITHHKVVGSANWGTSVASLALIDEARARGIDITMDQYPYTAAQSSIASIVPQWAQEGGDEALIERFDDPAVRVKIKAGIVDRILYDRGGGDPANISISLCRWDPSIDGKSIAEIAIERSLEPTPENGAEVIIHIIRGGGAQAVFHAMSEEDVERIMQHPATAIGSDGPLSVFGTGAPHPRQYGTFARVLGEYVRERSLLTLEDAIRKMSSATAQRLGIRDRGILREGFYADVAVFDAGNIRDLATFEDPNQYAEGMEFVLVNGVVVVDEGTHTGERPGQVIHGPGFARD